MSDFEMVHLTGFKCSKRAVRFEMLDPDMRENIAALAAKEAGPDTSMIEYKRNEWKLGVHQMIRQVSEPCDDPLDSKVRWKKYTAETLDEAYKELFTSKDHQILVSLFRQYHDVSDEEIKSIQGKVLTVSVD